MLFVFGAIFAAGVACLIASLWQPIPETTLVEFTSPHLLRVHTSNFSSVVTSAAHAGVPLLIAYYDPKSESFRELQPHVDMAGNMLGEKIHHGKRHGIIGVCDASLNNFLALQEAPDMMRRWQGDENDHFAFGRPNFFPMIIVHYQNGSRKAEYTGAVRAEKMLDFLDRHSFPPEGVSLATASAVRAFLAGTGPFALGCGIGNPGMAAHDAFVGAAYDLHGFVSFGFAPADACSEVMDSCNPHQALVIWLRQANSTGSAVDIMRSTAILENQIDLVDWLRGHRPELLEEMTPDNNHIYLEGTSVLVMLMVDPTDTLEFKRCEHLFEEIEKDLRASNLQLVWSDCRLFASQFNVEGDCPVVLLWNTRRGNWQKVAMGKIEDSSVLLKWVQAHMPDLGKEETTSSPQSLPASGAEEKSEDLGEEDLVEPFIEQVPPLDPDTPAALMLDTFHELLQYMVQLRRSIQKAYPHLKFDFSDVEVAQGLHPDMRILIETESDLQPIVSTGVGLDKLQQRIERRAQLKFHLDNSVAGDEETIVQQKAFKGYGLLRKLFSRTFSRLHAMARSGELGRPADGPTLVEKREASGLSTGEFLDRYARVGKPVIITGASITDGEPWSLAFFRKMCNTTARIRRHNPRRRSWARLEHAAELELSEFIDTFEHNATRRSWYLHDWSLPQGCPQVFGAPPYSQFKVPRYFAGDYLQRIPWVRDQHTWPSLFIGSNETSSALHVDSSGTSFWLLLLSGRKEWRLLPRGDVVHAYKDPIQNYFHADIFKPDLAQHPLVSLAQQQLGIQEAGDLIFIPGGVPHGVRNLESVHAVSMNYVDAANVWLYLWHALGEQNWRLFEAFTADAASLLGVRSDQESLKFGEWKSTDWQSLKKDMF